ncbi:transposase-like protein, IS1381 ISSpn7 [Streptococcus pneumoniae]|nr:transposase-like protein, IS1381 ISSpn7 [Streptococcus pneumoniae]
MNDEASKQLTDARFKRLVGVQRTTFEEILAVLKTAYQLKHAKGGRKPKLSLEDLLMATLQYVREYRTYEQIAASLKDDLDADSVDLMEFILTLEDEFSIEISDEEIDQLQSVGDVVKIIQGK